MCVQTDEQAKGGEAAACLERELFDLKQTMHELMRKETEDEIES